VKAVGKGARKGQSNPQHLLQSKAGGKGEVMVAGKASHPVERTEADDKGEALHCGECGDKLVRSECLIDQVNVLVMWQGSLRLRCQRCASDADLRDATHQCTARFPYLHVHHHVEWLVACGTDAEVSTFHHQLVLCCTTHGWQRTVTNHAHATLPLELVCSLKLM
jgi:hypothetical protein